MGFREQFEKDQHNQLAEAAFEGEGMSADLQRATMTLINKIIKTNDSLKRDAEKLDKRYKKETGMSFFHGYIYNDKAITKDDLEFVKAKETI